LRDAHETAIYRSQQRLRIRTYQEDEALSKTIITAQTSLQELQLAFVKRLSAAYNECYKKAYDVPMRVLSLKDPVGSKHFQLFSDHATVCRDNHIAPGMYMVAQFKYATTRGNRDVVGVYDVLCSYSLNRYRVYKKDVASKYRLEQAEKRKKASWSQVETVLAEMNKSHETISYQMELRKSFTLQTLRELVLSQAKVLNPYYVLCFHEIIPATPEYHEVQVKLLKAATALQDSKVLNTAWTEAARDITA
jgi:hypothetical protein